MFPDGDLNFLVIPEQTEVNLKQLTCTELHNKTHWAFIGEDLIKEHMISDMMANLKKYLEYEEKDDGANVLCIGTITVATR